MSEENEVQGDSGGEQGGDSQQGRRTREEDPAKRETIRDRRSHRHRGETPYRYGGTGEAIK